MDRSKQERLWFCVRRKSKRNCCGQEVSPEEMGVTPIMKHATYLHDLNLGPRIALREYEVNDRPWDQQDDCRPVPVRRTPTCNRDLFVASNITKRRCWVCCDLLVTMLSN